MATKKTQKNTSSREKERQELLDEDAKIKREATEPAKPHDTAPGYAGPQDKTVAGIPPDAYVDKPKGAVVGQDGTLTKPTEVTLSSAAYRKPTDADRIIGRALLEGDTFNGYHRKIIVELTAAVTQEGAFFVFKSHFPDGIWEGFKAKGVTEEEAKELAEEWLEEGMIPGQPPKSTDEDEEGRKGK
jgi:hypothetical protein